MSVYVIVEADGPVRRTIAVLERAGSVDAHESIRANRETWRAALASAETRFYAVLLSAEMRPFEAIEFDRTWGSDGVTHTGLKTVRSLLGARGHLKKREIRA